MTIKIISKKVKTPTHAVHVGNITNEDKSGYLGLIMSVNKNGKAIRIANRFNTNRVYILLSELPTFIEGLHELAENGVALSIKDVEYDAYVAPTRKAKRKVA